MLTIRQILPDEWRVLRALRLDALQEAPEAFIETFSEASEMPDDFWRGRAERGARGDSSFCVLAIDGDQPIGMAIGISDQTEVTLAYLVSMWVAPEFRGSGAATLIIDSVADWAVSKGAKVIFAGVIESNTRALAFYQKVDFEPHTESVPDHPATNGCGLVLSRSLL